MDYSEEELTSILTKIANRLANKFKFGYHQTEDMKQQAYVFALEALPRFNPSKAKNNNNKLAALEAFLYTHVHNRLHSFKRDNYMRPETPCDICQDDCLKDDRAKTECKALQKFYTRNEKKQNIMRPIPLESVSNNGGEGNMSHLLNTEEDIDVEQIKNILNKELDPHLRQNYIRYIYGLKLTKQKREELVEVMREIIRGNTGENIVLNNTELNGEQNNDEEIN